MYSQKLMFMLYEIANVAWRPERKNVVVEQRAPVDRILAGLNKPEYGSVTMNGGRKHVPGGSEKRCTRTPMSRLALILPLLCGPAGAGMFDGVDQASRPVMEQARTRIESLRKGDFRVVFVDEAGKPVSADVRLRLTRHEFRFGASLHGFPRLGEDARKQALDVVDELFNTVTITNYWSENERAPGGERNWADADRMLAWALEHAKTPRFHAMLFTTPGWAARVGSADEWWRLVEGRIQAVAERYGTRIHEYDVLNEVASRAWVWKENIEEQRRLPDFAQFSDSAAGARCFALARKYLPGAELVNNDANIATPSNPAIATVLDYERRLIARGAPIDVTGHQAHYYASGNMPFEQGHAQAGKDAFTMKALGEGLDRLAEPGKPVHITELSAPSRSNKRTGPQPSLTPEEIAAWEVNYYTLAFSKPYVREITRWFVIDELGGRGVDAGLITKDGKLKPSYYALRKLLNETWSSAWQGRANGAVAFRGFFGDYEVVVPGYAKAVFAAHASGSRSITVKLRR